MAKISASKKNYRGEMKAAKQFIKTIQVYADSSFDFEDLDQALRCAKNLEITAANIQYFINQMKAGA